MPEEGARLRRYDSPTRSAEAAATRRRIIEAAAALFCEKGYATTTMRQIAARAEVSVQSVHLAGTKPDLLLAALEVTFGGEESREPLSSRADMRAMMALEDPAAALDAWVSFLVSGNASTAAVWRAADRAVDADPAARAAVDDLETRRRADLGAAAAWAVGRGLVAARELDRVRDQLLLLTSPAAFLHFVVDSHWSQDAYSGWLRDSIASLLGVAGPGARRDID